MKVLFAVNNEKVSQAIVKKYQTMYKEIISSKNVYFFNAIIKELQKDKTYDRIVIGEDLEPYSNNNYEVIDNFLFDKLDSISDEASNSTEGDIPIILIASDRRERNNGILIKLFGIGIYNVLLGKDRSVDGVCRLINQPRTKKEAKVYYKIETDDIDYQAIDTDSVSETEIQNIIRHYKKLGKNTEQYAKSFDDIAAQYTDTQLKLITKFLPLNVRAVLEEQSPKYQQVMIGSVKGQIEYEKRQKLNNYNPTTSKTYSNNKIELIDKQLQKSKLTKPVVIPSAINMQNVKKTYTNTVNTPTINKINTTNAQNTQSVDTPIREENIPTQNNIVEENAKETQIDNNQIARQIENIDNQNIETPKKGRGRPKKEKTQEDLEQEINKIKRGRGRPKKTDVKEENDVNLFDLGNDINQATDMQEKNNTQQINQEQILPGLDDILLSEPDNKNLQQVEDISLPGLDDVTLPDLNNDNFSNSDNTFLPGFEDTNNITTTEESTNSMQSNTISGFENNSTNDMQPNINNYNNSQLQTRNTSYQEDRDLSYLLTGNKKIAAFVGTSKNGTSFLVNNLAALLSSKGINTAILDLTQNKNSYYIYTNNEDSLRTTAFKCIDELRRGVANGIHVNKNLTVYTTLPGENEGLNDYGNILETLLKNHSLVLLDCDYETNYNYFAKSQELYLVQTYDILTIQPLTAFLNELNYKNILDEDKLRIVINKSLNLRKLTEQHIIGGISCYNDPAGTFINTLFNTASIRYTIIPFEDQTYARYLERMVDCEISLNGYSKIFLDALEKLGDMVYPLIAGNSKYESNKNYNDYNKGKTTFNSNMNATLNKMRNKF